MTPDVFLNQKDQIWENTAHYFLHNSTHLLLPTFRIAEI